MGCNAVSTVTTADACQILEQVTDAVVEIDQECRTRLDDVEHGLVNVKREFRDRALREMGKKLTEERLIAWLVQQKLERAGRRVEWEVPYPGSRGRRCDLVVHAAPAGRVWVELKLAWKAWFNCQGGGTYSNPSYLPYLQGRHHTHSFRHDFDKLGTAALPAGDGRAVCLIGFDRVHAPMDAEVADVVRAARDECGPWETATGRRWPDRRCQDFRIGVWTWLLPSQPGDPEPVVEADRRGLIPSDNS